MSSDLWMLHVITSRPYSHERGIVRDAIEQQLRQQPTVETRNRKKMRPNQLAEWELRCGEIRVYYEVEEGTRIVTILAIARKLRNRIYLGDEEWTHGTD